MSKIAGDDIENGKQACHILAHTCRDRVSLGVKCSTPFGVGTNISTTCWPPLKIGDYWPTTLPCADGMSRLHHLDSTYMQQVRSQYVHMVCTVAALPPAANIVPVRTYSTQLSDLQQYSRSCRYGVLLLGCLKISTT